MTPPTESPTDVRRGKGEEKYPVMPAAFYLQGPGMRWRSKDGLSMAGDGHNRQISRMAGWPHNSKNNVRGTVCTQRPTDSVKNTKPAAIVATGRLHRGGSGDVA